jgi:predicted MFS family arabinose efflux permease
MAGALLATVAMVAVPFSTGHFAVIVYLSLAYAGITFQQPAVFSSCLDIGGTRGGAVAGFMNTAGQLGAALSSVIFGTLVEATGDYDAPLVPMAALLASGLALWLAVDVTRPIEEPTRSRR